MLFPTLETDRLKLIEITPIHTLSIFEILSLDEVTRYYGTDRFTSIEEARKIIEVFQKNFYEKRAMRWGIVLKENNKFIGTLGLNGLQLKNKKAEIGYEIHPSFWRKGYTSEAIKEVLRYSYQELKLNRIGAVVYLENEASSNLLQKLGFKKEGVLRDYLFQNNSYHTTSMFSLLKREWELPAAESLGTHAK
ncbi:GNAT family protein [Neobacillus niacini]|uniref:GNAT family N-acetyltransferase n=1 Tax=Neobacillus niacini TaxID=86668 RepID=UPI00052FAC5A|nr:GNAT family protein [Neobacillus niacini]KGM44929.1 acetyltransferase [Neobacillus niacini]MEC1520809.1 GNAT family protein [Neobacillus niacini]